jgi:DNA polymerase III delta subunit
MVARSSWWIRRAGDLELLRSMGALDHSQLHAVIGTSYRLRDVVLDRLLVGWNGPVKRHVEPDDLSRIVLDLGTPSLFEDPACQIVRGRADWVRRQKDTLLGLAGIPIAGGVMILVCDPPARKDDATFKALAKANAVHVSDEPGAKELPDWVASRLGGLPQGCNDPRRVAFALLDHVGNDIDAVLGAIEVLAIFRGEDPIDVQAVGELYATDAAKPLFAFSDAVLEGDAGKALKQLHAEGAAHPEQALGVLVGDLRKLLAVAETDNDGEAARLAGLFGRPNLYHPRRRAKRIGRPVAQRLLRGAVLAQRAMRSGSAPLLVLETLVLHARSLLSRLAR